MNWLLIDNSNTRTKFALADSAGLQSWRGTLNTAELDSGKLSSWLEEVSFDAALIASVVPGKAKVLEEVLSSRLTHERRHFLNHLSPVGMKIDYPQPQQIGADRLANAAGVVARHRVPAIVIDFGTAVTFDVISAEPAYCGGVIAPGLGAMSGYLTRKTALLPEIELIEPSSVIGKSTEHAMQAGAVFGYRGLIREIIARLKTEMEDDPVVIATGGDAALISRGVSEIDTVDPDLTLDGLRQVAARIFG